MKNDDRVPKRHPIVIGKSDFEEMFLKRFATYRLLKAKGNGFDFSFVSLFGEEDVRSLTQGVFEDNFFVGCDIAVTADGT